MHTQQEGPAFYPWLGQVCIFSLGLQGGFLLGTQTSSQSKDTQLRFSYSSYNKLRKLSRCECVCLLVSSRNKNSKVGFVVAVIVPGVAVLRSSPE